MTYRVAEFREVCLTCGKDAAARCARCGDPFCSWHLSTDDQVCEVCEEGYQRQRAARHDPAALAKGVAIVVAVAALTYVVVPIRLFGLGLGLAAALLWASIGHYLEVGRRRRYLSGRRRGGPDQPP